VGVTKALLDLTNAYLALEALLETQYMSRETRVKVQKTLRVLAHETDKEMKKREAA
jgi:hypothetical protein